MGRKDDLIKDIEQLLNSYDNVNSTSINPEMLAFMDEKSLLSIIDSLLKSKERVNEENSEWLEKFKKYT